MSPALLLCDWNGTLITDRDEKVILHYIARYIFWASIPFHPFRMASILSGKKMLDAMHDEDSHIKGDFDRVRSTIDIYNRKMLQGVPISLIHKSMERYARQQGTLDKLDYRLLRVVEKCHSNGITAGVFSAGLKYGIEAILEAAGYRDCFDLYMADVIEEDKGKAIRYGLTIYNRKPEVLLKLLDERNVPVRDVAYIGDSEDDTGCFEIVGYPIVSFLAPDELKQKYARSYNAFVPETEDELLRFLTSK
jgi:phosphoserine phosphatase